MAEWLAHPNEYGVLPKQARLKRTYRGNLITHGDVELHLVEYEMPDGAKGRGFVNKGLTWSFLGDKVNAIKDDDLLVAYCGWAWLFPAMQAGNVATEFLSLSEEAAFRAKKEKDGLENLEFTHRYKIVTSELFEYLATKQGKIIRGAGDTASEVSYEEDDPRFNLPSIYFHLGSEVIRSMR
ncbi:MAG TPA: hypothetical protein VNS57_17930 [Steroidobacteraceae bacterium]|nr:hypothetical protein [Steroidobacteraceae bacterium]